jgi:UDP-N-acetylglucosamine 2-epimerase (non-hydrolysing)
VTVLVTFGTRPEAIKLAPVLHAAAGRDRLVVRVCATGQHRDMLDAAIRLFALTVHHDLDVMTAGQSPTQVAAAVLSRLEPVLRAERPEWVVVQGDTTTAMAAAIGAFNAGARVAHVEAGLRTGMLRSPFPEESNRRVITALTERHFAPTENARRALLAEGVPGDDVLVTGNTVIDALKWACAQPPSPRLNELLTTWGVETDARARSRPRLVLVTAHRRENFGAPLERICHALVRIATCCGSRARIVYPVHPNPNVRQTVERLLRDVPSVSLIEPLDYVTQAQLMARAWIILTDSGGIQEEAPSLGVPVLVLSESTERPEALTCGAARLVGTDEARLVAEFARLWDHEEEWRSMRVARNPFGDGHAAARIVAALLGEAATPFAHSMTAARPSAAAS